MKTAVLSLTAPQNLWRNNMDISIRKATTEDFGAVLNILEMATLKLLAKDVHQWEYPWNENEVKSYIENDDFYIAQADNQPVGCFGLKKFTANPFADDNNGLYFYHLAVHPQYSGIGASHVMCKWIQDYAQKQNITIYFDCWAGNNFLRKFYTEVGFEHIGDFPEEDYFVSAFKTR